MRVGGRLENSQSPYSGKHPIILPSKAAQGLWGCTVRIPRQPALFPYTNERFLHQQQSYAEAFERDVSNPKFKLGESDYFFTISRTPRFYSQVTLEHVERSLRYRLPLHRNMDPVSTNPDAHNVYKRDTGFIVSGDCTIVGSDVHNAGSGDCHLTYGDCSGSTSSGGGRSIQKIHDVYNAGSGNVYISYCGASTSSEEMIHDIHNAGSGQYHIKYVTSDTNIHRRLVNDVRNGGSGAINITYKNCGSRKLCGKLANDVYIAGSGSVYVSTSSANSCGPLVNNVHDTGSGRIFLQYGIIGTTPWQQRVFVLRVWKRENVDQECQTQMLAQIK
ncbi:hypothetical protein AVEN_201456-1 [Araneus ventricosus]|uniref:Uncharacterized protein n=1 Tax=Araneus ventricosus TaxID=182803 RepID=A0A4Y2ML07_ARAVE|nr:hypothetical protein AVEN_201456-1 [Araneus ventricosus]